FEADTPTRSAAAALAVQTPRVEPSELQKRRRELEHRFTEMKSPLDAPERQELWREMALVHSALHDAPEAVICWANAVWERESAPESWAALWRQTEMKEEKLATALDAILDASDPRVADVRSLAVGLVWAAVTTPHPREFAARLDRIHRYLEKHDRFLSVRGA